MRGAGAQRSFPPACPGAAVQPPSSGGGKASGSPGAQEGEVRARTEKLWAPKGISETSREENFLEGNVNISFYGV